MSSQREWDLGKEQVQEETRKRSRSRDEGRYSRHNRSQSRDEHMHSRDRRSQSRERRSRSPIKENNEPKAPPPDAEVDEKMYQREKDAKERAYKAALKIKAILAARKEYVREIDINDIKTRYVLVRQSTRQDIKSTTAASVTVTGKYLPDRALGPVEKTTPLTLRVSAPSEESLDAAIKKLEEIIGHAAILQKQALSTMSLGGRFLDGKCEVPIEDVPGFGLRGKLVGPNGSYLKYVTQETNCRVQVRGKGSGYTEADGREGEMPMWLHITGTSNEEIAKGKKLCEDLVKNTKVEFEQFLKQKEALDGVLGAYGYIPAPGAPPNGSDNGPAPPPSNPSYDLPPMPPGY